MKASEKETLSGDKKALLLAADLIFFLVFPLLDGPVWCVDSYSYASVDPSREPLYPMLLALFRRLFGGTPETVGRESYLFPVVLLQAVLAACAVWVFSLCCASFVRTKKGKLFCALSATLPQWGVVLLNRFAAERRSSYQESIMTEGIALSLYLLFLIFLLQWETQATQSRRSLSGMGFVLFLLISTRKQLLGCAVLALGVSFLWDLLRQKNMRRFAATAGVVALAALSSTALDYAYNYGVRGIWMPHTGNSMGLCSKLFYTAQEEDAASLGEEAPLFAEIVTRAKKSDAHWENLPDDAGWMERTNHYSTAYDVIGYEIMNDVIGRELDKNGEAALSYPRRMQAVDAVEERFVHALLRQDPGPALRLTAMLVGKGMLNSIARAGGSGMNLAGTVLYVLYAALFLLICLRGKSSPRRRKILFLAALVLLAIVCNVLVTSAVIYPQSRYAIYSMGAFYTALALMVNEAFLHYN